MCWTFSFPTLQGTLTVVRLFLILAQNLHFSLF
jgi:hypothetical protein